MNAGIIDERIRKHGAAANQALFFYGRERVIVITWANEKDMGAR
jgi:hypothetical protein